MASTNNLVTESVSDLSLEKLDHEEKTPTSFKLDLRKRFNYIKELITVEPLIGCYILAALICSTAINSLEFEKSCRSNNDYNDTICDSILSGTYQENNFTEENNAVQKTILTVHSWQQPLQSAMPVILILFLGSYSDRHKIRKPFLVLPIFGEFFSVIGCILNVIYMKEFPLEVQGAVQTIVPSLFGGSTMITMACFAYISDVSTLEMRTIRIGIIQIVLNAGGPIVQFLSGTLFVHMGYIGVFLIALALYVIGFLYGIFCIKEPKQPVDIKRNTSLLKDLFDVRHAIDTIMLLKNKTEGNDRTGIITIMWILAIYFSVITGEVAVFFLYTQNVYEWTAVNYNNFLTVNTLIHLVGVIVALPLFTKVFKWSDATITSVAFLDKVASSITFIIYTSTTGLYAGTVISIVITIANISIRSQATKVVSENDLGKAQSLFAIVEAVAPAIATFIYNQIYGFTLKSFPQAFFLLGIFLYIIGTIVVIWFHFKRIENPKSEEVVEVNGNGTENGKAEAIVETTPI